jgi:hypothetical protein
MPQKTALFRVYSMHLTMHLTLDSEEGPLRTPRRACATPRDDPSTSATGEPH